MSRYAVVGPLSRRAGSDHVHGVVRISNVDLQFDIYLTVRRIVWTLSGVLTS